MIQQIIRDIVAELQVEDSNPSIAPTFIFGTKGWNNLNGDEIENTIVVLIEPVTSQDRFVGALIQESYPLLLAFLEKSELENTPEQELVYTDRMRRLRAKFLYRLKQSSLIQDVTNITTSDEFKVMDACLSGVGLQVTVVPLQGQSAC